jgi:hypothetical protein
LDEKEPIGAKEKGVGGKVTWFGPEKGREFAGALMEVGREVTYVCLGRDNVC